MSPLSQTPFRAAMNTLLSACALSLLMGAPAHAELEINQATEAQLDSLLHVGPALSQKILSQRQQSPFADWADLIHRVPGIGPRRARQLRRRLGSSGHPSRIADRVRLRSPTVRSRALST